MHALSNVCHVDVERISKRKPGEVVWHLQIIIFSSPYELIFLLYSSSLPHIEFHSHITKKKGMTHWGLSLNFKHTPIFCNRFVLLLKLIYETRTIFNFNFGDCVIFFGTQLPPHEPAVVKRAVNHFLQVQSLINSIPEIDWSLHYNWNGLIIWFIATWVK